MFDWFIPKKPIKVETPIPVVEEEKPKLGDTRICKIEYGSGKVGYSAEVYDYGDRYSEGLCFRIIGEHGEDRRFGTYVPSHSSYQKSRWSYDKPEPFEYGTLELAQYRIDKYLEYKRSCTIISTTYIKYP